MTCDYGHELKPTKHVRRYTTKSGEERVYTYIVKICFKCRNHGFKPLHLIKK